jgi:hypothetical protein
MTDSLNADGHVVEAFRAMYRGMLEPDTALLDALLVDEYALTHMTGYAQPKREWLALIDVLDLPLGLGTERASVGRPWNSHIQQRDRLLCRTQRAPTQRCRSIRSCRVADVYTGGSGLHGSPGY